MNNLATGRKCKVCGEHQPFGSDGWRAVKAIGKCMRCYHKTQKELKKRKNDAKNE